MTDDPDRTGSPGDGPDEQRVVTVLEDGEETRLTVPEGTVLRDALLSADISPYTRVTERLNCGGRGICATCGVRVAEDPDPEHWHDGLADRFGYPRLSCQILVEEDLQVSIPEKVVWGSRE